MSADALARLAAPLADRYRIERELGSGGMATVYLAEDVRHHRKVALKLLHPPPCSAAEVAESLGEEGSEGRQSRTASYRRWPTRAPAVALFVRRLQVDDNGASGSDA